MLLAHVSPYRESTATLSPLPLFRRLLVSGAFINVPKDARELQSKGQMAGDQIALKDTLFDIASCDYFFV